MPKSLKLPSQKFFKKKNPNTNVYIAINSLYAFLEKNKLLHEENTTYWSHFDMSKVRNTTALLAFTDIPKANLKHWNMSNVEHMEGMFYKSTFIKKRTQEV